MADAAITPARAVVTTVVRRATLGETSGWLHVVDLASGRVERSLPVAESARRRRDPNPRGGVRGARGVAVHGGRLVVANTDALFLLDEGWRVLRRITHPWLGDVHALVADSQGIWVTCTAADLLVKLSWEGNLLDHWSWRGSPHLRRELGIDGSVPEFAPSRDYRDPLASGQSFNFSHLNAVARGPDGLVVGLGRLQSPRALRRLRGEDVLRRAAELTPAGRAALRGVRRRRVGRYPGRPRGARPLADSSHVVVEMTAGQPAGTRVLVRHDGIAVPNHDLLVDAHRLLYTDTNHNRLVAIDLHTGAPLAAVKVPGRPAFARGLAHIGRDRFLVGSQRPAALHGIDLAARTVLGNLYLSADERESVFAVAILPPGFGPVPGNIDELAEPRP